MWQQRIRRLIQALLLLLLVWTVYAGTTHRTRRSAQLQQVQQAADRDARRAIRDIDERLGQLVPLGRTLAERFSLSAISNEELQAALRVVAQEHPELNQVGVAYTPYAFHPSERFYAPYFVRRAGELVLEHVQQSIDYTVESNDTQWFHRTLRQGAGWSEPYYDPPTQAVLAEYVVPIVQTPREGGAPRAIGVVYVNYSLTTLADFVASSALGRAGYGVIVSERGRLAYHPNRQEVVEGRTLAELARNAHQPELETLARSLTEQRTGQQTLIDPLTGRAAWVFYQPLRATRWSMAAFVVSDSILGDGEQERRFAIRVLLSVLLMAGLASALALRIVDHPEQPWRAWLLSAGATLALSTGVGGVWWLERGRDHSREEFPAFVSQAAVNRERAFNTHLFERLHQPPPLFVPLGITITQAAPVDRDQMRLSGHLWVRSTEAAQQRLGAEIVPILEDASVFQLERSYERSVGGEKLVGWRFRATVKNNTEFERFPFDRQQVVLRFSLRDEHRGVLLVPDLYAYEALNPSTLPGAQELQVPGWQLYRSAFSFERPRSRVDFGAREGSVIGRVSRMCFVVDLQRSVVNAFIAYALPIIVVLLLLFVEEQIGLTANQAVGAYRSAFFIVIIAHVGMRSNIGASVVVYLEWFFLVTYLALLGLAGSTIASVLYASSKAAAKKEEPKDNAEKKEEKKEASVEAPAENAKPKEKSAEKEKDEKAKVSGNRWVKLLYLPSVALALLIVTLAYFY